MGTRVRAATLLVGLALLVGLVAACEAEEADGPDELDEVVFTGAGNLSWLNVFVAHDEGIFAEHGIDSQVELFDVGFLGTEAVVAGEADTAGSVEFPFLGLYAQGAELAVPAIVVTTDDQRIVVDESIEEPADLEGASIGLIAGSAFEYAFEEYLDFHGVDRDSVEFVDVDAAEQVAVLGRGDIDGFLNVEPVITRAFEALDDVHLLEPGIEDVYTTRILLQMRQEMVEEDPELTQRVLAALQDAADLIHEDRELAAEIGAEWTDIDEEDVAAFLDDAGFDYTVHYDEDAFERMQSIAEWMVERGDMDEVPDLEDALRLDPLREVDPDAVDFDGDGDGGA